MASARSAWGIDVGNRALKAVKLVRDGDRLRVDGYEIIEHESILSQAGDNKESLLKTALAQFVERHQTKGSDVAIGVSGQSSFARFIKLPPVEPKQVPNIVKFEAIQQIPFPLDDVEWSYQLFQAPDSPDVEVGIFAMRKDLVNRHISHFTDLGLNVQVVQMHPLAVYNAMAYDERVPETTMFMDSGAENTDLIIADGQTVWLRTLPIGGNNFTEALAKAFKLNFQKAEDLKRTAATSKYAKQIFQAMRPVFADLVSEVQRSMGFYGSVHRDAVVKRIVAMGSTFQLPGLQKYLQQNLQLPVEKLDSFRAVPPGDAKTAAAFSENAISLAGAYGLAVQAMGEGKITSSLLPERIRRAKMWQEKTKWFAAAAATFVLGTAGIAGSWYYHNLMYDTQETTRSQYNSIKSKAQGLVGQWTSEVQNQGEADRSKIVNIRSLQTYRETWPTILSDVFAVVPHTQSLEELKAVPRKERKQIVIDNVATRYWPDIKDPMMAPATEMKKYAGKEVQPANLPSALDVNADPLSDPFMSESMDPFGDQGIVDPFSPTYAAEMAKKQVTVAAGAKRGFVMTIRGSTPNGQGGRFIDAVLVKGLQALNAEKQWHGKRDWYVERAQLVQEGPRKPRQLSVAEMNLGGLGAFGVEDKTRKKADPEEDLVFPGEKITEDVEFVVVAVVVMDPPEPEKKPEEESPTAAAH